MYSSIGLSARTVSSCKSSGVARASSSQLAPPSRNTGVQCTVLPDWVSLTIHSPIPLDELVPYVSPESFVELDHGAMGYRRAKKSGNITLYYDGQPGMGQHLRISGQGCRELEAAGLRDWSGLFEYWLDLGGRFTRLDVAMDDRAGLLSVSKIEEACRAGNLTSRFRSRRLQQVGGVIGQYEGETLYFGERASDVMIRIYNKAAERAARGEDAGGLPWVRVELEAHRERAQGLAVLLADPVRASESVAGVLLNYLDFKEPSGTDSNTRRWATVSWWVDFLGAVGKCRLSIAPVVRSIDQVERWLVDQVASSLAVVFQARQGDLGWLIGLVNEGRARWGPRHRSLLGSVA